VIAGYGTPHERAIAAITAKQRGGRRLYRLAEGGRWTSSLERVAAAAVSARERRDTSASR
jgi:predicted phosphoadenosine phosphosulfate sulfurtransferase